MSTYIELLADYDKLEAQHEELIEAVNRYMQFLPQSSAKDGGAARFSEHVLAADNLKAVMLKANQS